MPKKLTKQQIKAVARIHAANILHHCSGAEFENLDVDEDDIQSIFNEIEQISVNINNSLNERMCITNKQIIEYVRKHY